MDTCSLDQISLYSMFIASWRIYHIGIVLSSEWVNDVVMHMDKSFLIPGKVSFCSVHAFDQKGRNVLQFKEVSNSDRCIRAK
jgi:hypothetical protein